MAADLGDNPDIGGDSVFDYGYLSLMGQLFICGFVTSESKPSTLDDVDVGAPDFCSGYLFFSNDFQNKLYDDAFYEAVNNVHKTGTLATDAAVSTPGNEDEYIRNKLTYPPSNHPGNQDYY